MSHIVKASDLQHIFGNNAPFTMPEEQLTTRLELLARSEGANKIGGYNQNYRLVAERSGNNPATRIFLRVYDSGKVLCHTFDNQQQHAVLHINNEVTSIDSNPGSYQAGIAGLTYSLTFRYEERFQAEEVSCNVTDLHEVEKIQEFLQDHPDLLPSPMRERAFPPTRSYKWVYIGAAALLIAALSFVAYKSIAPKNVEGQSSQLKH